MNTFLYLHKVYSRRLLPRLSLISNIFGFFSNSIKLFSISNNFAFSRLARCALLQCNQKRGSDRISKQNPARLDTFWSLELVFILISLTQTRQLFVSLYLLNFYSYFISWLHSCERNGTSYLRTAYAKKSKKHGQPYQMLFQLTFRAQIEMLDLNIRLILLVSWEFEIMSVDCIYIAKGTSNSFYSHILKHKLLISQCQILIHATQLCDRKYFGPDTLPKRNSHFQCCPKKENVYT